MEIVCKRYGVLKLFSVDNLKPTHERSDVCGLENNGVLILLVSIISAWVILTLLELDFS